MMLTAGIDIGSISTKAAVLADGKLLGSRVIFTGYNSEAAGKKVSGNSWKSSAWRSPPSAASSPPATGGAA